MSQLDDAQQRAENPPRTQARLQLDWTVAVVLIAMGATLAWVSLWLWAIVHVVQLAAL